MNPPDAYTWPTSKDAPAVVWVDPGRKSGQPCIYGSRLTTRQVAHMVAEYGIEYVREGWPYLTDEQIEGACWFEREHGHHALQQRIDDLEAENNVLAACVLNLLNDRTDTTRIRPDATRQGDPT